MAYSVIQEWVRKVGSPQWSWRIIPALTRPSLSGVELCACLMHVWILALLLPAEGVMFSSLSGRPGTDVHWNLESWVWSFLGRYVKQDWNQAHERSHRYSMQAESALPFVPAIMVRKSLQTHEKETGSFNELGNPSSRKQSCELTFHSLSREALCPSVTRNQSQSWRKEKGHSCYCMHSPSLPGSAGASACTGQALPYLDFPKPEQDLAMTTSDSGSSR